MFKRGCNKCGEEWYIGNPSTCKCQTNDQPKREWVSLTKDDVDLLITLHAPPIHPDFNDDDDFIELVEAIEAKLREKNT